MAILSRIIYLMQEKQTLGRTLSMPGLLATGVSSMIGASIYIVPFMIQKNVPGIGPYVLPAFLLAAIPALLAAFAYAILASAMPRAGGSYVFVSRSLGPYWGFSASFSQWFGLSLVIGVVAYMVAPFVGEVGRAMGSETLMEVSTNKNIRLVFSMSLLWIFILVNIIGLRTYQVATIALVIVTFLLAGIVIVIGWVYSREQFMDAVFRQTGQKIDVQPGVFNWTSFLSASGLLFASFIGFDAIAQAGGEARNPGKTLPRAIIYTFLIVSAFYLMFTASVYRLVPWNWVASEAATHDISATGLVGMMLDPFWSVLIVAGACIALMKDLPSMILSVSRLVFAWAKDGLFPAGLTTIHAKHHTPVRAILFSGGISSLGVLGSHFAGDIFLGIDIMVIAMLWNFLLTCMAMLKLGKNNPALESAITVAKNVILRKALAVAGIAAIGAFILFNVRKDISLDRSAWYLHSTYVWLLVMLLSTLIFVYHWNNLKKHSGDAAARFKILPEE